MTSVGRRPIRLDGLRLKYDDGDEHGWVVSEMSGVLLEEHGHHRVTLDTDPNTWRNRNTGDFPRDFMVADKAGNTYKVERSKRALEIIDGRVGPSWTGK